MNYALKQDLVEQIQLLNDLLNQTLPVDVKIGSGTNKAGTTIRTLALRIKAINEVRDQGLVEKALPLFFTGEACYRAFAPSPICPMGDIIEHRYHDGLMEVVKSGFMFKTRDEARRFLAKFNRVGGSEWHW
jgi:hypothetical protein